MVSSNKFNFIKMEREPSAQNLLRAREIIRPFTRNTTVLTCRAINALIGASLFFKCENFQKGGAFKIRGASHAISTLNQAEAQRGVCTHSSGNHAQALSLAASLQGIKAYVVMPDNSSRIKIAAVEGYGGSITFCNPTLQDRESTLKLVQEKTGAVEIHSYNDYRIIAGQASACAELTETVPGLNYVIAPVGGGGLLSGTILAARYFSPNTKVIGAEPLNANDTWQTFTQKKFVPSVKPNTIADGLRTSLGSLTYPIILNGVHDVLTASEESIIRAMRLIWERMKIIVEPSGALPLAVLLENPGRFTETTIGLILSGGNIDLDNLPWVKKSG